MSRTRKHQYTWQYWGEERRQRSLRKEHDNWKVEAMADLEVEEVVYIIINEWEPKDSKYSANEIVDGKFFESEDDAWEALMVIADAHGLTLEGDETSFEVDELPSHLNYESYYIQELTNG